MKKIRTVIIRGHQVPLPVGLGSVGMLICGLVLMIWPKTIYDVVLNFIGAALMLFGIYEVFIYFKRKSNYISFDRRFSIGMVSLIAGIALICFKYALLSIVPLLFGLFLLISGIVKLQAALNMRGIVNLKSFTDAVTHSSKRWLITFVSALIPTVLGALIMFNPFSSILILVRVIGAAMIVEAVEDFFTVHAYKKIYTTVFGKGSDE